MRANVIYVGIDELTKRNERIHQPIFLIIIISLFFAFHLNFLRTCFVEAGYQQFVNLLFKMYSK